MYNLVFYNFILVVFMFTRKDISKLFTPLLPTGNLMMYNCLLIKLFSRYTWYAFHNKTQKKTFDIYIFRKTMASSGEYRQCCLYSPDNALVVRNIYIEFFFCVLL